MYALRLEAAHEQVVVVLGASSGIGRASALQLSARGAKVVVSARSEEALASVVAEIIGGGGDAACVVDERVIASRVHGLVQNVDRLLLDRPGAGRCTYPSDGLQCLIDCEPHNRVGQVRPRSAQSYCGPHTAKGADGGSGPPKCIR